MLVVNFKIQRIAPGDGMAEDGVGDGTVSLTSCDGIHIQHR